MADLKLSAVLVSMPRSGIRAVMDLAWATPDVIHLEVGEPNFATPEHVVEAACRAAAAGHTKYTPNAGLPALREACAAKIAARNGYEVAPEQVTVTNGAVEALYSVLLATVDPGDEVLVPDPGWPNFRMMVQLLGAVPTPYPLRPEDGYLPDPAELERRCGPRTRVLILNSPANPLGAVLPPERVRDLLAVAADRGLWVLSDECYDEIAFARPTTSVATADADGRVASVYSFSKTYAMTGWRVGYAATPPALSAVMATLQEPLISCVNAPAQHAALAALTGPQDAVEDMRRAYAERCAKVCDVLEAGGLAAFRPHGAFYVWVDVRPSGRSSTAFATSLIRERAVAVVPGPAFGSRGEGWVRISVATSTELLLEGAARMVAHAAAARP